MRTHAVKWALLLTMAALCFVAYAGVQGALGVVNGWTKDLPSIEDTDFTNTSRESVMFAGDESTLLAEFQLEKRDPVTIDRVSEYVLEGTVDTEDVRFYEHEGVDIPGIARAFVNNLRGGDLEGASTITQQLIRNTVLSEEANDISFERKIREAQLAIDLEKRFSKDDILMKYLNIINYGDGCYGIEAAAQNYFQVSALDLTLAQAATLVGIPQSPTYLDPKQYPDACLARRNIVLDRMLSAGDISQEEHDAAQAEALNLNPAPDAPEDGIYAYHHFASYVRDQLLAEGNPYSCSYADLFKGGLTIYTSLDPDLQEKAETACADQRDRMDPDLDTSLVAIDTETGQVKAMVGGKDWETQKFNIATGTGGTGRQAGSIFKAFTLAAAIEQGISPQTLVDCTPLKAGQDGAPQDFENFGNINYGIQTILKATAVSSNTGYLRLSNAIGQSSTTEMAHRLGVTSEFDTVYTTTEGVADVTPLEMASAYATLATSGIKHDPVVITKIVDRDGVVIYEAPDTSERVLDEDVANATTKVLRSVFELADATAYSARLSSGQPVAGKTGTASSFTDHWLVGYTPSLSCATWIGYPSGSISTDESLTCNQLWQEFMNAATEGREIEAFAETKDPPYNNPYNIAQKNKLGKKVEEVEKKDDDKDSKDTKDSEASDGKKDANSAPSAVGKTFSQAIETLNGYDAEYIEEYSDTVPTGTVISQSVVDGKVRISVSLGPKPSA